MTAATPVSAERDGASMRAAQLDAIRQSGWGRPFRLVQPHNPAFWLYVVLVPVGVLEVARNFLPMAEQYATAAVFGGLVWVAYTVPWVWFLSRKDRWEREPLRLAAVGFVWGGFVALGVMAMNGNDALLSLFTKAFGAEWSANWGPAISAPFVEESAKGAGVVVLFLLARPLVRSVYDGLLLGAFVGLGFQIVEDWTYTVNGAYGAFGQHQAIDVLKVLFTRGILTGINSHALMSALVGAGLMYLILRAERNVVRGVGLIVAALAFHAVHDANAVLAWIALPISIVMIVVVERVASRRERTWMRDLLAPETAAGTLDDAMLAVVAGSAKERRAFVRRGDGHAGRHARRAAISANLDLAEQIAIAEGVDTVAVGEARERAAAANELVGTPTPSEPESPLTND